MKKFFAVFILSFCICFGATAASNNSLPVNTNTFSGTYYDAGSGTPTALPEGPGLTVSDSSIKDNLPVQTTNEGSFRNRIVKYVQFFLGFLGLAAVIAIIYAGVQYIIAAGDDSTTEKAKTIIKYAAIGIVIILLSYAIVYTLLRGAPTGKDPYNLNDSNQSASVGFAGDSENSPQENTLNFMEDFAPYALEDSSYTQPIYDKDGNKIMGMVANPSRAEIVKDQRVLEITNTDAISFGDGYMIPLFAAKKGIAFQLSGGLSEATIDFGDGVKKTINNGRIIYAFSSPGKYRVQLETAPKEGKKFVQSLELLVGKITTQIRASRQNIYRHEGVAIAAISSTPKGSITEYNFSCSRISAGGSCPRLVQDIEEIKAISNTPIDPRAGYTYATFKTPGEYRITVQSKNNIGVKSDPVSTVIIVLDEVLGKPASTPDFEIIQ